jgi:sterol 3beta-glucosyltransferase
MRDHTLAIEIQGQHDLRLGFSTEKKRDEGIEQIHRFITVSQDRYPVIASPTSLTPGSSSFSPSDESLTHRRVRSLEHISDSTTSLDNATAPSSHHANTMPLRNATSILAPLSRVPSTVQKQHIPHALKSMFPKAINVPEGLLLSMPSKHFVCLTIGSRGDVQPYIALGRGLQKEGHKVTVVTHEEYKEWVTGFGVDHRTAGGDPGALMKLSVENKVFETYPSSTTGFPELTLLVRVDVLAPVFQGELVQCSYSPHDRSHFLIVIPVPYLARRLSVANLDPPSFILLTPLSVVLVDSWEQCKDADVLLESPSAMAGVHIAEALRG